MATSPTPVSFREYGDAGLLVEVLDQDHERRWARTQALGERLRRQRPDGLVDVVASFTCVFVSFDPLRTDRPTLEAAVTHLVGHGVAPQGTPRRLRIPVVYGGSHGPDLAETAELLGMTADEVVARHTGQDWVVRFVASPAGAPLMDGSRWPTSLPRLAVPRPRVDQGSLGLSGFQSIIYNASSPGGWRLIGRTPVVLFDLGRPPYAACSAGDRIRFRSVPAEAWDRWAGHRPRPEAVRP